MGTYKVTIEKFLDGQSYGTDDYFVDGCLVSSEQEAKMKAFDQAQFEDEDEFNDWKIISVEYYEDE